MNFDLGRAYGLAKGINCSPMYQRPTKPKTNDSKSKRRRIKKHNKQYMVYKGQGHASP